MPALAGLEPLLRGWGLRPTRLPVVVATATEPDTVGALEVRWAGDDDATVWPTMTARVLVVPDTIGLSTDEANEHASEAGLDWTVRCNEDREQPEGIIDQEPPATAHFCVAAVERTTFLPFS